MAFIDGVLSHYEYVKAQILAVNPNRKVAGQMFAQDWPPKDVKEEAFYLLSLGDNPIGRQGFSPAIPIVGHELQWTWIVKGQDIGAGQVGPNRGIRFQNHFQMKDEMRQAQSPYFCEKKSWGYNPPNTKNWVGTSLVPQEFILWAPPTYRERLDKDSGVVYGIVSVRVFDMLDPTNT